MCVGFLQAERKDDRIGGKEGKHPKSEGLFTREYSLHVPPLDLVEKVGALLQITP
jgi:hypothetical protein